MMNLNQTRARELEEICKNFTFKRGPFLAILSVFFVGAMNGFFGKEELKLASWIVGNFSIVVIFRLYSKARSTRLLRLYLRPNFVYG